MWFVTTTRIYDLSFLSKQDSSALTRKRLEIMKKWKEEARNKYMEGQEEKKKRLQAKLLKISSGDQKEMAQPTNTRLRSGGSDSNV